MGLVSEDEAGTLRACSTLRRRAHVAATITGAIWLGVCLVRHSLPARRGTSIRLRIAPRQASMSRRLSR